MPWYLDETYQATEVTWRLEPGQTLPDNLADPLLVPNKLSEPIRVSLLSEIDFTPDFVKGFVPGTVFVSSKFKK